MCDFRGPPYGVKDLRTNEVILTGQCRAANGASTDYGDYPKKKDVTIPGMYHIAATGSYYSYFDGDDWWEDKSDWGPPSDKYWQDIGGIPPGYLRYEFLRTEENEQIQIHCC